MNLRIVVADDEWITRKDLVEILEESDFVVEGQAKNGIEAVEICRKVIPDVAIVDIDMPILNGLDAAKILIEEKLAKCVIVLTAFADSQSVDEAIDAGVISYLVKPFTKKMLIPAIRVAYSKQMEIDNIKGDLEKVESKLEDRKIIEKAKGVLSERYGYSEEESYKKLRKMAMDNRTTMINICKSVVLSKKSKSHE